MRTTIAVLLALFASACGGSLSSLAQPAFVRSSQGGMCGTTRALDVHDDVWGEGGCEGPSGGLALLGRAAKDRAAGLRTAFDALTPTTTCPDGTRTVVQYQRLDASGTSTWTICDGVPFGSPWNELESAFSRLLP